MLKRYLFAALLIIFLVTPALSGVRQEMDWGDITVAQEILRMQGYRGLTVIRGSIDNHTVPVELYVEAVTNTGLVAGLVLRVPGGDILSGPGDEVEK